MRWHDVTRRDRARQAIAALGLAGLAAVGAVGCGKKPAESHAPPPQVTGLAAVPATAEVVIGADIAKLSGSPVIDRAVDQLLLRDATLAERWGRVKDGCKVDIAKQIKRVMLAIGPSSAGAATAPAGRPGTGPVLMIVVGSIPEADLKDCVGKLVGGGGGAVTGKPVFGRTLYLAKDGNRTMYFGYGRPDTIVLGSSEAYVTEALGDGKKATDNPDLTRWLTLVDQSAPLWAVGRIDARVRDGLVAVASGKLRAGPLAMAGTADLSDGAKLQLGVVMATPDDARSLESYARGELALLTAAAQWKSLGAVVGKVTVAVDKEIVYFRVPLGTADLNQLLSALDGGGPPAQDSAPPNPQAPATPGSGASPK
jgi:hypothetical protein